MDAFFEQLVKVKNSVMHTMLMVLSVVVALLVCVVFFWLSGTYPILILGIVAIGYGEWKLLGYFHKEYEYIITNGTVDVDRIIAKSTRSRIVSFECSDIIRAGKYSAANPPVTDASDKYICGNTENAYYFLVKKQSRKVLVVMSLNDKMLNAIKTSVPRNTAITLFSEISNI